MKLSKSKTILIILLILFGILSYPLKSGDYLFQETFLKILIAGKSEINIIEISQAVILFYTVYVTIAIRKKIIKEYNLISLILRIGLLVFLFYEEISFFTEGLLDFTSDFTMNNQLNIHNAYWGGYFIINDFQIPFTSFSFSLNLYSLILIISTLLIGYGSYISILKTFNFFFLDKKYSFFFLIYLLNFVVGFFLSRLNVLYSDSLIYPELLESFFFFNERHRKKKTGPFS